MDYPDVYLKRNEDKRLRKGHLWVFSNEIDIQRSPLNQFPAGAFVQVKDADGKMLGCGYINPHALICVRLWSRKLVTCNVKFFKERFQTALNLREKLYHKPFYRLIFGESDGLPGLVVDRFGSVLSVQISTLGMDRQKDVLLQALVEMLSPQAVVWKNDGGHRLLEGLSLESAVAYGELPDPLIIEENDARYMVDILSGQKTGWFYDHRSSRAQAAALAQNLRVLDLFSYTGAWGVAAALGGASHVVCVDASEPALNLAAANASLNGVADKMSFIRDDVFAYLKQARSDGQLFGMVILDPPALIKRKKDFKQGYEAYRRLIHLVLPLLAKNGILVAASCSFHLDRGNLQEILRASARHIDRHLVFFATGGQSFDHPVDPAIPETDYLKTFFCYINPSL